jgi:hypothetical protein
MYRISKNGYRIDEAGPLVNAEWRSPVLHAIGTATGTQLQNGGSPGTFSPFITIAAEGRVVPIAWNVFYDYAGGTMFTGNTTLQLTNSNGEDLGEALLAISGGSDRYTVGSITGGTYGVVYDNVVDLVVKDGNPTGGHAAAKAVVHVLYIII